MNKQTNIILMGYRCSGKTSVGKIISERTGMDFYDTDTLIEKSEGRSIEEIVAVDGWKMFREIEKKIIRDASGLNNAVLATGGGVAMDEENVVNLKRNGYVVWLESDADVLMKRMAADRQTGNARPSLTGVDPVAETIKVLEMRNPFYRKAADFVVNTDRLSIDEVADKVIKAFSDQRLIVR